MTDRELMQQALEALEWVNTSPWLEDCYHAFDKEVAALRERLAQPEEKYEHGTPLLDLFTQPEPIKESSVTHSHLWIGDLYGKGKNT